MLQSGHMTVYSGKLVLVVGAAGSGKGVLLRRAKDAHPEIEFALSTTTRAMRPGEVEGVTYHYISKEAFEAQIAAGEFLEWASIDGGMLYGTPKDRVIPALTDGKLVVKEMEIQGLRQIQEVLPKENVVTIYIDAGSWETLSRRVQGRAPLSEEELESRRERYEYERQFINEADFVVQNFDGKFEEADQAFEQVLASLATGA